MAKMLPKDLFVLRHGLFRRSHISDPVINDIKDLALPRDTIYHFMDHDGLIHGPRMSDPLMKRVEGIRYIQHIEDYYNPEIRPIRKPGSTIAQLIQEYRTRNRSFRRLMDPVRNGADPRAILIYNYSLIPAAFTFPRSIRAPWIEFSAQMQTLIKQINDSSKLSGRDHYYILELPETLPTIVDLINCTRNLTSTSLRLIPSFEDKFIFELFRWLGRGHKDSLWNRLDPKVIARTNIVVRRLDKWMVLNLGWLTSYSEHFGKKGAFEERRIEVIFLKLLSDLYHAGRPFTVVEEEVDDSQPVDGDEDEGDVVETVSVSNAPDPSPDEIKELEDLDIGALLSGDEDDDTDGIGYTDSELDALEKELLALTKVEKPDERQIIELDDEMLEELGSVVDDLPEINVDVLSEITGFDTTLNPSVALAGELNSKGVLTNNEYKRIVRLSEKFKEIENPYEPGELIVDSIGVEDISDIEIEELEPIDEKILVDPSLGKAKIDHFENTYIDKFLKKDIVEAVAALQKGPVLVTDYTVERTEDSQNDFETHTIKIAPVVGPASTIRQILPVVKEDGTFKYNGTDYRMKMQRVDMPIRKINDTTVALNSYYGKLFVELNQRSASDYTGKLANWIKGKLVDPSDRDFVNGSLSDVHHNDARISLAYGGVSKEVDHFTIAATKTVVCFNFRRRHQILGVDPDTTSKMEGRNFTVFAVSRNTGTYYIDRSGTVHQDVDGIMTEVSSLEAFLGVDTKESRIPTPQVGMKIYSKTIPIGFCLAYLIGFENLLKVLKSRPRRVNMGERSNLSSDEYEIKFRNQTLVFNRSNVLETIVLSGFQEYARYIKDYDLVTFDTKAVYNAIIDRLGIGNRYMKKLDSTSVYFIDPITEKVLKLMNEPTEFLPLILRACEMLVTSYVPTEAENAKKSAKGLTRLRGYERVAGFAYETMVKAIEAQSMRQNGSRTPVTVNPWDTMQIIRSDPTVAPSDNLNPIQFLREREVVVYTGRGGRNKRSMVARSRIFTEEDVGVISEATVDSGDVGVIVYASQDADIRSVYGTTSGTTSGDKVEAGRLLSSASLLSPNADGDDQQLFCLKQQVRYYREVVVNPP